MNEAPTADQASADAKDGLLKSLGEGTDFSAFKTSDDAGQSDQQAATEKTTEDRSDSEGTDNADKTSTLPEPKGDEGTTETTEGDASNRTDTKTETTKEPPKGRAPQRIQELLDKDKANALKIKELEDRLKASEKPKDEKPAKVEPLVPEPKKPHEFTEAQLLDYIKRMKAEGNEDMAMEGEKALRALDKYERDIIAWEFKNGQATREFNGATTHYKNEALKKWPDLAKAESEHAREFAGMRGVIGERFPETLKKAEGEYYVALISDWKMKSGRLDAAQAENKKLREEIEKLKKGALPITTKEKSDVNGKDDSPDAGVKSARDTLLTQLRGMNMGKNTI